MTIRIRLADVCRQMGISEATFYVWKKRYGNLGLLEVRELRQLRDENARLKRLVVDLTLDRHILQEVVKKRSDHGQASRHRSMDTGLLSAQRPPVVLADSSQERDLVLLLAGAPTCSWHGCWSSKCLQCRTSCAESRMNSKDWSRNGRLQKASSLYGTQGGPSFSTTMKISDL
jgi:putative transposase